MPVPHVASMTKNLQMLLLLMASLLIAGIPLAPAQTVSSNSQFQGTAPEMREELKAYPHKLVYESFHDGNFELYMVNADGTNPVNLTKTADVDELYPKVSPDGKKICFCADEGKGKDKARNLYLMNTDGTGRMKIADNSREPCWSADGKSIAFMAAELKRFTAMDYCTTGIIFYDVASGQARKHPNSKIMHLYCPSWTPDGNWFVSTVHGGMGFKHAILALEANGDKVFDLSLDGCRPDVSPDGKHVAWGHGDWAIGVADLDFSGPTPKATNRHNAVQSKDPMKTYHADWSPDGRYIAFSYGNKLDEKSLGMAPEIPGIKAMGWNICVADASKPNRWVVVTLDGASNKEPDWVAVGQEKSK
ncbi:MAG: hypothetical protein NTX50_10120 [Candidatus Sumerlaeota bacterium]|nr:hypothetical protein [Candidatus Sumerlaeota bacterium]